MYIYSDKLSKEKTSSTQDPLKFSFPEGTTSLCIEYKVACMYRCGMQCLSSFFMTKLIIVDNLKFSHTAQDIYMYIITLVALTEFQESKPKLSLWSESVL